MRKILTSIIKPSGTTARWLILLALVALVAANSLGYLEPVRALIDQERYSFKVGQYQLTLYKIIKIFIALAVIFWFAAIVSDFGERRIDKLQKLGTGNKALIVKIFQIVLYFFAFLLALDVLGLDLTALTVFGGALGIGIGFGLQKITSNFISGMILLFEKSIEVGDLIELSDGTMGFVRHTGARYTRIETWDNKEVMVPNEDFITNRVTNLTFSNNMGRISIPVGVSYKSDIEKAHELILEAAMEHPQCLKDPQPACFLREFADSSVNFLLYFWVADVTKGRYRSHSDVMFSIWRKFKENDIAIPFPQRDLHIKDMPGSVVRDNPLRANRDTETP
jgi:small-conductance mechanosensitive channel